MRIDVDGPLDAAWMHGRSPAELFDVDPEQFDELLDLFLASDQAGWISGQVLAVDGGGPRRAPYPGVTRTRAGAKS